MCFEQEFKTLISTSYIYTLVTFRQCSVKMDVLNMNVPLFGAELQGVHLEAKKKIRIEFLHNRSLPPFKV